MIITASVIFCFMVSAAEDLMIFNESLNELRKEVVIASGLINIGALDNN